MLIKYRIKRLERKLACVKQVIAVLEELIKPPSKFRLEERLFTHVYRAAEIEYDIAVLKSKL